ncbi:MAG: hypothetical protein R3E69_01740 [Steroidobacteraceae bacterium]
MPERGCGGGHAADRPPGAREDRDDRRRQAREFLDDAVAHVTGNFPDESGLQVIASARCERLVRERLQRDIRGRRDRILHRLAEAAQRAERLLAVLDRAAVAGVEHEGALPVGQRHDHGIRVDVVAGGHGVIGVGAQDTLRLRERKDQRPAEQDRRRGVQAELERGDDTEIAAAAPQCPVKIGVFGGARTHEPAVGGHQIGGQQVVAGEAELAGEAPESAAEREARDTGMRYGARRRHEPEGLCLAVELAEQHAGLDTRGPRFRIDTDAAHARKADHQSALADRLARNAVAAAAHGDEEVVARGEFDGVPDVCRAGAMGDQRRPAIEVAVPDAPRGVESRIAREQQPAAQPRTQVGDV